MIVCLDSGNSRIKWGVHDGERWLAQGAVDHAGVAGLAELVVDWPAPRRVMLANVAGPDAARRIRDALAPWAGLIDEVRSAPAAGGVVNGYENPEKLGVDRWCALIGARDQVSTAAIVVMAGTATTVDALAADGRFLGGLILPGLDLMRASLARGTAGLPLAAGRHEGFPRNTDDAIVSGAIEAQAGAIERMAARLGGSAVCLLSGGAAAALDLALVIERRVAQNLPLEGLRVLARSG